MAPFMLMAGLVLVVVGVGLLWGPRVAVFVAGCVLIVAALAVAVAEDRRKLAPAPHP